MASPHGGPRLRCRETEDEIARRLEPAASREVDGTDVIRLDNRERSKRPARRF